MMTKRSIIQHLGSEPPVSMRRFAYYAATCAVNEKKAQVKARFESEFDDVLEIYPELYLECKKMVAHIGQYQAAEHYRRILYMFKKGKRIIPEPVQKRVIKLVEWFELPSLLRESDEEDDKDSSIHVLEDLSEEEIVRYWYAFIK